MSLKMRGFTSCVCLVLTLSIDHYITNSDSDRGERGREDDGRLPAARLRHRLHEEAAEPDQEDLLRAARQGNACVTSRHLTLAPLHKGCMMH